ncbi:MAG: STAS domain-containing protein [candidate division KSB1 bacterium]|nr:STAS domain-containing protein [candidate division KSB1 bacterium]MDZ7303651.1 STAS domain-containing protein [candidate division KSB1 bacterium]MDZ7313329.1 STAS domain-containing protein [candidate division KSB1 bacterium]
MFDIRINENGDIALSGRFDASKVENAKAVFDEIENSRVVDFRDLEYISSAGLSVLLATQKRLSESGGRLKLKNMSKHIRDVFRYAGFDMVFEIEG